MIGIIDSASSGATPPLRSLRKRSSSIDRTPLGEIPIRAFAHFGAAALKNCEDHCENFSQICLELSVSGLRSFNQYPNREAEAGNLCGKRPPERNWNHAGPNLMISHGPWILRGYPPLVRKYSPHVHGNHERKDVGCLEW